MKAPRFWSAPAPDARAWALAPLGAIYGAATRARMARRGERVDAKTIVVGNFVAGGAGKTPTALALARLLQAEGAAPAFLTRGYGGRVGAGPARVEGCDSAVFGDEALLLAAVAPTYAGADRAAAARMAITQGARTLILDDGLQSRRIEPDLALAVVDGASGIGNGFCLPAGPLRAPLAAQARRIDALVLIGAGAAGARVAQACGKPAFRAHLQPDAAARALAGRDVLAFAGLGRPEKFFAMLDDIGARIVARRVFADHHRYSTTEAAELTRAAEAAGAVLATTRKDAVRWPKGAQAPFVVDVALVFEDEPGLRMLMTTQFAGD